ncbi:Kynurenine 3-monooxygenase [Ceratocystis fimbriata CBS 114723]|uniref:Kynurenine 3-monooxygenase n=1 Tax=Ceratocystis fimbriata CBS 114723 TaxID=1035309 RepID=A0A2C5XAC6_9PEZI|nr:Kynurenine 3-monooxygenase [Ceratocystis fimbriata CBS 114723]
MQKTVIVGGGPVGSLAALYAAHRGHEVEVYELRPDLRDPSTVPLNFTRSINLAVSERGINAMRNSGFPDLLEDVFKSALPMRGRMIHGRKADGTFYEEAQDYDPFGRTIFSMDRTILNKTLLDTLEAQPNVKIFFSHKLTGVDFRKNEAWFEINGQSPTEKPREEIRISFDFLIGADGAHSLTRYHLMKFTRMNFQQEYVDTLWCEFRIDPLEPDSSCENKPRFAISPGHLHIWPGKDFMFIAIPSDDGSFVCTLFLPSAEFSKLEADVSTIPEFFDCHFPGVTELIKPSQLVESFTKNPHLPLVSIKAKPYHCGSSAVIVGDAAHAMVPFYAQGLNCGMEDVRILFSVLDKYAKLIQDNSPDGSSDASMLQLSQRAMALNEYTEVRVPDAHVVNDLALQNYIEMRASVLSRTYLLRKWLEEKVSVYFPALGWKTRYMRISFSNERYSEVLKKTEHQGKVLSRIILASLASPFFFGAVFLWGRRHQNSGLMIMNGMGWLRHITNMWQ